MRELPEPHRPITLAAALAVGQHFELGPAGVRALELRGVNPKEAFTVRDAGGHYFRATLIARDKNAAQAEAYEKMPASPESPARITLACAVLARQRMLVVMQKATELGVTHVVPVLTERSVQRDGLAHEKAHAWPGQVQRAVRQCRRGSVPVVSPATPLPDLLAGDAWRGADVRVYLDDRAMKNSGAVALPARGAGADVVLLVGPEGGLTDYERRLLDDERAFPLRLGARVLRAETAVFVGLTLLQHRLGDLALD